MMQDKIGTNTSLAGGGIKSLSVFDEIISLKNLHLAWKEFKKGKGQKKDVQEFEKEINKNLYDLYKELEDKSYNHSDYFAFCINDPKPRKIHKACVKDRVLHHAIFRILYPIFDKSFIFDSYSCRNCKGTHAAINRLGYFINKVSKNNSRKCFVLKCDIRKFFGSIDQEILLNLIKRKICDKNTLWLIKKIIKSFPKGLPLGNITSQLFANIYLNALDKFAKHSLGIKHYIRYCDDFVIVENNKNDLFSLIGPINKFLKNALKLSLHQNKVIIKKNEEGVDFLGYVIFSGHRLLRTKTKRRMLKAVKKAKNEYNKGRMKEESFNQKIQSYLGMLKHCRGYKIKKEIL